MARKPNPETKTVGPCRITTRMRTSGKVVWRVAWTDALGKERERIAPTAEAADAIAAEVFTELNMPGAALQPDVSFEALAMAFLNPKAHARWRSPNTLAKHRSIARNHLVPRLPGKARSYTPERFNAILEEVRDLGYAPRTIKDIHDTLRGIVRFGQSRGVWSIWEQPLDGVAVPAGVSVPRIGDLIDKANDVPTPSQVGDLVRAVSLLDPTYGLMLQLCAGAGLRWGELVALRPCDLDVDRRRIFVRRQVREVRGHLEVTLPKHEKQRITIFPADLVEDLRSLLDAFPATGRRVGALCPKHLREEAAQLLFLSPRGSIWRRGSFGKQVLRPAREASSYPDHLAVHSLRHYWVCDLIDRKRIRIPTVSKLAGHHSPSFTKDRYWGADDDYLDEALDATA